MPITCQVTDLQVYIDNYAGYCFAYPQRFSIREFSLLGVNAVQGPTIDTRSDEVAAAFAVQVRPSDLNLSLDQQVDNFLMEFTVMAPETLTKTNLTVGGEPAIQVDNVPVQLSWRLVFVAHESQLYRLMYWPVDVPQAQADLEELYQTTLNSFAFLSSNAVIPSPGPMGVQPIFEGVPVSFGSLSFVIPPGVASGGTGSQTPRIDGAVAAWWQLTPGNIQLMLDGYSLQNKSRLPAIYVYPAQEYAALQTVAAENIQELKTIQAAPGMQIGEDQLPVIPFYNEVPVFTSNDLLIPFQNGQGVRTLTQYGQYAAPANNNELFYQFQGLTSDGAYYIVAILPIIAPGLGESSDPANAIPINGVPYPTMGDPNANWKGYYSAVTDLLNSTPPKAFTPTLAQLDVLIQSMLVTP